MRIEAFIEPDLLGVFFGSLSMTPLCHGNTVVENGLPGLPHPGCQRECFGMLGVPHVS